MCLKKKKKKKKNHCDCGLKGQHLQSAMKVKWNTNLYPILYALYVTKHGHMDHNIQAWVIGLYHRPSMHRLTYVGCGHRYKGDPRTCTIFIQAWRSNWGSSGFSPTGFFSWGGDDWGSPHPAKILPIPPPIRHLSPFLDQGLSPPAEVWPENLKYF